MVGSPSWIGGAIYTQNLARAIASLPPEERDQLKVSVSVNAANLDLAEPIRNCVDQIYARRAVEKAYLKICKILAERVPIIPLGILNPEQVDFVYPTVASGRAPYQWGGWIPDFQHYHMPEFCSEEEIVGRNLWHKIVADNAPVIVLSSKMAQDDFCHLYPEAASRSTVMHFATCPGDNWFNLDPKVVQATYELPDRFFLVSNQFWKHKDHAVIFQALELLKQRGVEPLIVCTGNTIDPRNPDYYSELLTTIEKLGVGEQVRILGLIPRSDQIQLMRRCLAVIQPSRFEGWSTVVEDARTLAKPMLISDFPVHLEQDPPDSHFFEQGNAEQLATLISQAIITLNPGPNLDKETLARSDNTQKIMAFGRCFLKIVQSTSG